MRMHFWRIAAVALLLSGAPAQSQQAQDPELIVIKIRPWSVLGSDPPGPDVSRCDWSWSSEGKVRTTFNRLARDHGFQGTVQVARDGDDHVVRFDLKSVSATVKREFRKKLFREIASQLGCG